MKEFKLITDLRKDKEHQEEKKLEIAEETMLRKLLCSQPAGLSWEASCTQNTKGGCTCMISGIMSPLSLEKLLSEAGFFCPADR